MTAAAIGILLATGALYLWFRRRAQRLSSDRLATLIGSTAGTAPSALAISIGKPVIYPLRSITSDIATPGMSFCRSASMFTGNRRSMVV